MRRVCRHLFTLCAAVSLVLCVATAVLWTRGDTYVDEVSCSKTTDDGYWYFDFGAMYGDVAFAAVMLHDPAHSDHYKPFLGVRRQSSPLAGDQFPVPWAYSALPFKKLFGVAWYHAPHSPSLAQSGPDTRVEVIAPIWIPLLFFAILPAFWFIGAQQRWRRWRKRTQGRCSVCGYDLRASPGRCPECGTAAAA